MRGKGRLMRHSSNICSRVNIAKILTLAFFIFSASRVCAQDTKTLENGLRVIIKEDHRNPIVVFSVFIDVGSAWEGDYLGSGISHLTEHMLFKGTAKYPTGTIENILHKYGGKIDGFTSYDYTGYRITILKEHKDIALDILKEMLTRPAFDKQELKKEMAVIEREMDLGKDDPGRRVSRLTFSNAYIAHPYKIPVIGYKENFKRLGRDDLIDFFNANYAPENIVIAVVGDIEKEDALKEIEHLFGGTPRGKNKSIVLPEEPQQIAQNLSEEALDIDGAYLNIAFHSTSLLDRDLHAMDLLSFILGDGEGSMLNEELRIKQPLVLAITAYNYTPKDPGLFVISSVLKEESIKNAMDEILKVIDDVKENGVSDEDLLKAKNNFLAGYIYQKETIGSQADDFATAELLTGNPEFFEFYVERIKSITREEIQRSAKRYLTKDNMTIAIVSGSGNALAPGSEDSLQKEERRIKKITLENKLPVLISEDHTLPIVAISLLFKAGVRIETEENNGISGLTSTMFIDGTMSMPREEIVKFYESRGMAVSAYSGNNSVGILVKCLKEHVEDALSLASELCMSPSFPENELKREKAELISAIEMQDNQIFNHGHRLLKKLLFKTHPYGFQAIGTIDSVARLERQDLADLHKGIASADNMVLGVSGDCNANEIEDLVKKYFSAIPSGTNNILSPEKEALIKRKRTQIIETDKEQSLVLIGFHGVDIYNKDRYALEIMVNMFSGQSGIFFKSIRGKQGLSYSTGAFHAPGIDPGYIVLYTLTSKQNIDKVKEIMLKETAMFVKKGAAEEDIQKSKNYLKAMRQIEMQTNASFIFGVSLDELYGLGYDNYKNYNKIIDSVTKEDIKRAAKRFLTLDRCAILILEGK